MPARSQRTIPLLTVVLLVLGLLDAFLPGISIVHAVQPTFTNGQNATLVLGQTNFTSSTSATTQSGMGQPNDVAVDLTTGKIFVVDRTNNRVLRYGSLSSLTNGAAAEGVLGQPNFTSGAAATTQSGMNFPLSLAFDNTGRLWVMDTGNSRALRFDNAASKANGANADGVLGQPNFTSSAQATTQSGMYDPYGLALDSAGRLWVADQRNNRVVWYDNAASKANGANADGVLGQPNFTSGTATTAQSGMRGPLSVSVDSAGRLWVADTNNHRVLRFDNAASKANGANADGVLGQTNFTSGSRATAQNRMYYPYDVQADTAGRLWVADTYNHRALWFDAAASKANGANADGVLGQADFTSGANATAQNRMFFPQGVGMDGNNQPWVADTYNSRALYFGPLVSANADLSNLTLSSGTLSPAFVDTTINYTANVANGVSSITVTPTVADADATVTVNGVAVASGTASGAIPLSVGANTITVVVTAADGTTKKTTTITVTRAAPVLASVSVSATPGSIEADGGATATVVATALDSDNNPVVGQVVSFTTTGGTLSAASATTGANGQASVTLTAPTSVGSATVTATAGSFSGQTTVTFSAPVPPRIIASPLTIFFNDKLAYQVNYNGVGQIYPKSSRPADYATFLATGGTLYGQTASNALAGTPYTTISQSSVTGAGTIGSPFVVKTTVGVGTTGLQIEQTDTYINGQETYRSDIRVINTGTSAQSLVLYRGMNCSLAGNNYGYGKLVVASAGSVACVQNANGSGASEQLYPLSAGASYYVNTSNAIWAAINTKLPLPNAVKVDDGDAAFENGQAIAWNFSVPAGSSVTRSHLTTFSASGSQPLISSLTASPSAVGGGANINYTLTITNPNSSVATLSDIVATLPAGFSYRAGTSAGVTTSDPVAAGQTLDWSGSFSVGAGVTGVLTFGATAGTTDGSFGLDVDVLSPNATIAAVLDGGIVTVDNMAPSSPTVSAPTPGSTTGNRPAFSGTAEPRSTVKVTDNGVVICTIVAAPGGAWSCTAPSDLSNGTHTVTTTATDSAGNTSQPSASLTYTVDATKPDAPIIAAPAAGAQTKSRPTFSGTAEPGTTVTVLEGNTNICSAVATGGAWTCTPSFNLVEGMHNVTATATDGVGNVSQPSPVRSFVVDVTPPLAPHITAPSIGQVVNKRPTFSGIAEPGSTVTVTDNGVVICTAVATTSGAWSCTPTSDLTNGSHTVTTTATDEAGNTSSPSGGLTYTVDTIPPALPKINTPTDGAFVGKRPPFSGTGENGAVITVRENDIILCTTTVIDGGWNCDPTVDLSDGSHTVIATATDEAGNVSDLSTGRSFTVDTVAPTAPAITSPATTSDKTPAITGTAPAGLTVRVQIDLNGDGSADVTYTTTAGLDGSWSIDTATATPTTGSFPSGGLADSSYTLTAVTVSLTGIESQQTGQTLTLDATPPAAATITSPNKTSIATPLFTGTGEPGTVVTLGIDLNGDGTPDVTYTAEVNSAGFWSVNTETMGPDGGSFPTAGLANGNYTIIVTTSDAVGNVSAPVSQALTVAPAPFVSPTIAIVLKGFAIKPTLLGTAMANHHLRVRLAQNAPPASVSLSAATDTVEYLLVANASGTWQIDTITAVPTSGKVPAEGYKTGGLLYAQVTDLDAPISIAASASAATSVKAAYQILIMLVYH